jgi:hypothetical protein
MQQKKEQKYIIFYLWIEAGINLLVLVINNQKYLSIHPDHIQINQILMTIKVAKYCH